MSQKKKIRVLLVDDSADDRELILMNLKRGGYEPDYLGVDTKEDFTAALDNHKWDLILCDYSMPGFDGIAALNILNERNRDIPFILVSGAIGEELAVKVMKAGAHDYLMKDNLQRLVPVVEREINEAENRMKHREAEQERDRLLTVIQHSLNEIYIFDANTLRFRYLNQAASTNLGYTEKEITHFTPVDLSSQIDSRQDFNRIIQPLLAGEMEKEMFVTKHIRKDGSVYPIEIHLQLIRQQNDSFFTAIGFDLTDREKDARRIKEQKAIARELALHSQYKSEFLANMSHELRTPLNSIILLSKLLLRAKDKNLTPDQANFVDVIHQSGNNLLELINEVLDLSKIEAGEMEISLNSVPTDLLLENIKNIFTPLANEKEIPFKVEIEDGLPPQLVTDQMRVEQVLKNLLSNAFKFTEAGSVTIRVFKFSDDNDVLIGFRVKDTGIGIPKEMQSRIFESFRQVDGSTQRRYGGTGLGLTICRKISELLGGTITISSIKGEGSTFTLIIPADSSGKIKEIKRKPPSPAESHIKQRRIFPTHPDPPSKQKVPTSSRMDADHQTEKETQTHKILVGTNDQQILSQLQLSAKDSSFEFVIEENGERLLEKVNKLHPSLVILDPYIPNLSGLTVAKSISDNSDIPIWFVTDKDKPVPELNYSFVNGILQFPLEHDRFSSLVSNPSINSTEEEKTLLLIDDNKMHNSALKEFVADTVDRCLTAESAKEAFILLNSQSVHCIVLDLTLPDANGADVLKKLSADDKLATIPVIIYSGKSLSKAEKSNLMEHASDIILKNVGSHAKLLNCIATHMEDNNSDKSDSSATLKGKTVLIVDDDQKSYFALSSHLQSCGIKTLYASTGEHALEHLFNNPQIDIVLMDIMMPDMDGMHVIKKIRKEVKWQQLPIISVTAKAMRGDRETCLKQGATDYVSKPVDPDKLLAILSIWSR